MLRPGSDLVLLAERPVAGGRMLARHEGQVVLVAGTIPGERVRVRVERAGRDVVHAATIEVLEPHPDRRAWPSGWSCGGTLYGHIVYPRQLELKSLVIEDALARLGRLRLDVPVPVAASPEQGYRLRARLHVRDRRVGFFREGTHELCDAAATGQLLPEACEALDGLVRRVPDPVLGAIAAIELAENVPASQRAFHLECRATLGAAARAALVRALPATGVTGLSVGLAAAPSGASRRGIELWGSAYVTDVLPAPGSTTLHLRRHVQAFFQANRYLVAELLDVVLSSVDGERMLDLYAGVGLFALALAAAGRGEVVAVEADPTNVADLRVNARPSADRVKVVSGSVEAYLGRSPEPCADTVIVDPPRTGMSRDAMAGVVKIGCRRVVYVSCDVATLARDIRRLVDAGYHLDQVRALDLFPNTPHVEVVAVLTRA